MEFSFDFIFKIVDQIIGFSQVLGNFLMKPLGQTIAIDSQFIPFADIPIIGSIFEWFMNIVASAIPWTPLEILGGTGLLAILGLIIFKRLIPVA